MARTRFAATLVVAAVFMVACTSGAPMPGDNGPQDGATTVGVPTATVDTTATATADAPAVPPATETGTVADTGTAASPLPGLSAACTTALNAELAISNLFAGPVAGHKLTPDQVSAVFDPLASGLPAELTAPVQTLHQAATSSVGKTDVQVAAILEAKDVAGALQAVQDYVTSCTPSTT